MSLTPEHNPVLLRPKARRGYAGRSAEELVQERRQRLIDTGLQLFTSQGYSATNTEQICREAKVTTRHFYEQFTDKEALLVTLYDQHIEDSFCQVSMALIGSALPLPERLWHGLDIFLNAQLDDPRRARLTTIEFLGVSARTEARRQTVIRQFAQLIETYFSVLQQQGHAPAQPYHILAVAMVGAMHELQIAHLNQPEIFGRAQITQALQDLLQTYLLGLTSVRVTNSLDSLVNRRCNNS